MRLVSTSSLITLYTVSHDALGITHDARTVTHDFTFLLPPCHSMEAARYRQARLHGDQNALIKSSHSPLDHLNPPSLRLIIGSLLSALVSQIFVLSAR